MIWHGTGEQAVHKRSASLILSYTKSATSHTRSISHVSRRKQDPKG